MFFVPFVPPSAPCKNTFEKPPSYSAPHPEITADTTPSPDWSCLQCQSWIREFLIDKCSQPRNKADKNALKFKETGKVMFALSRGEWEGLILAGGYSIFLRIEEVKKENVKKEEEDARRAIAKKRDEKIRDAKDISANVSISKSPEPEPYISPDEISVAQEIEELKKERQAIMDGWAEQKWKIDEARTIEREAWNKWSAAGLKHHAPEHKEHKDASLKLSQEENVQSRAKLRRDRIDLDLKALGKDKKGHDETSSCDVSCESM